MGLSTAIGRRLSASPGLLVTAVAVGTLVVAADLTLVWWAHYPMSIEGRGLLAVIALVAHIRLVDGDLASLGLRFTPVQGWWPWCRASLWIGAIVLVCVVAGLDAWVLTGHEMVVPTTAPGDIGTSLLHMCLFAPILEEVLYRLAPCVPLAVWPGPWRAVAVSGLAFGGLHLAYGNPSPENLLGGYFLAWAYLRSGSLAVPVVLHAVGNLFALAARVGAWYWFGGAA